MCLVAHGLDCMQSIFSLEVQKVFNPKQARSQKVSFKQKDRTVMDYNLKTFGRFLLLCLRVFAQDCVSDKVGKN